MTRVGSQRYKKKVIAYQQIMRVNKLGTFTFSVCSPLFLSTHSIQQVTAALRGEFYAEV